MRKLLLSPGSAKNHERIVKGGLVASILISIGMCAMLLPAIFNR
jgi:hypothetical protein